jgi:pentatricopeptide repeat protein
MIASAPPLHTSVKPFQFKKLTKSSSHLHSNLSKLTTLHQTPYAPTIRTHPYNQRLRNLIELDRCREALELHAEMRSLGHEPGVVLESMLIHLLMKSDQIEDAFELFGKIPERNIVTWTSIISGLVRIGAYEDGLSLFSEMLASGIAPNDFSLNVAIKACTGVASVEVGEQVHSLVVRLGLLVDTWTANSLIDFYSKCGSMSNALMVFDRMPHRNLVSYTSLISGYCFNGLFESAIQVFHQMMQHGIQPNEHTFTCVLTACGPHLGKQLHSFLIKNGIHDNLYSGTALIDFYSRNHEYEMAGKVFQNLKERNIVTWCSIISSCIRGDQFEDALNIFNWMILESIRPNEYVLSAALGACRSINVGKQFHSLVIKYNFVSDICVVNALISMYSRIGHVEDLEAIFIRVENPDLVTWSAVVSGYFQNGFEERSITALCYMHHRGYTPNDYALSSGLSSCAGLALFDQGRQFHGLALKLGFDLGLCGGNALINMYFKCGCVDDAEVAFDAMCSHDATSWNSLIHGYAYHGRVKKVIELFNEMEFYGILPDDSTFLGLLFACNHGGLVEEALQYFALMKSRYGIIPSSQHYACMVDILGRNGRLEKALRLILEMQHEPDMLIWKTLLGSCRLHGNLDIGKVASDNIKELSKKDSASYVLMSNLYAMHGDWDEAGRERRDMDEMGLKKKAGWSSIEIKNEVHCFFAGDRIHREIESVYGVLGELSEIMKDERNISVYLENSLENL